MKQEEIMAETIETDVLGVDDEAENVTADFGVRDTSGFLKIS